MMVGTRILQPHTTFQFFLKLLQASYDQSNKVVTYIFSPYKYMITTHSLAFVSSSISIHLTTVFISGTTTQSTLDGG